MSDEKLKAVIGTGLALAFCVVILVIAGALTIKFLDWLF